MLLHFIHTIVVFFLFLLIENMRIFVIIIIALIFFSVNTVVTNVTNAGNEASTLYANLCENLENAFKYRNKKDWQKCEEIEISQKKQCTAGKHDGGDDDAINSSFTEWQIRFESIRKFFAYCDFLKVYADASLFYQDAYRTEAYEHIAVKPQFFYPNGDTLPISDAMRKIVMVYKQMFKTGKSKLSNCLPSSTKNQFPKMCFANKHSCTKVLAWVYMLKKGLNIDDAKSTLSVVKMHLLTIGPNNEDFPFDLPYPSIEQTEMEKTSDLASEISPSGLIGQKNNSAAVDEQCTTTIGSATEEQQNIEQMNKLWAYKITSNNLVEKEKNKNTNCFAKLCP